MKETILPYTQLEKGQVKFYRGHRFAVKRTKSGFTLYQDDKNTDREIEVDDINAIIMLRMGKGSEGTRVYTLSETVEDSFGAKINLTSLSPKELAMILCLADDNLKGRLMKTYSYTLPNLKRETERRQKEKDGGYV